MGIFLSIISIAVGILQIILFFKLWGMANNTFKIKNCVEEASAKENNLLREAQLLSLQGDLKAAEKKYQEAFYTCVISMYENLAYYYSFLKENAERDKTYQAKYNDIVSYYEKRIHKIGANIDYTKFDSFEKIHNTITKI